MDPNTKSCQIQQVDGINDSTTPPYSESNESGDDLMQVDGLNDPSHSSDSDNEQNMSRIRGKFQKSSILPNRESTSKQNIDHIDTLTSTLEKLNISQHDENNFKLVNEHLIPENMILSTLSFTDLENFEKKIDPESVKRFLKLKEQYQVRKTAHESCELNETIYESMAGTNPDLQPMAIKAKSLTDTLKDELDTIETEILELTKTKRNIEFKDPKYGKKSTYKSSISGILPSIEANSKRKIWNVWNRIADPL